MRNTFPPPELSVRGLLQFLVARGLELEGDGRDVVVTRGLFGGSKLHSASCTTASIRRRETASRVQVAQTPLAKCCGYRELHLLQMLDLPYEITRLIEDSRQTWARLRVLGELETPQTLTDAMRLLEMVTQYESVLWWLREGVTSNGQRSKPRGLDWAAVLSDEIDERFNALESKITRAKKLVAEEFDARLCASERYVLLISSYSEPLRQCLLDALRSLQLSYREREALALAVTYLEPHVTTAVVPRPIANAWSWVIEGFESVDIIAIELDETLSAEELETFRVLLSDAQSQREELNTDLLSELVEIAQAL